MEKNVSKKMFAVKVDEAGQLIPVNENGERIPGKDGAHKSLTDLLTEQGASAESGKLYFVIEKTEKVKRPMTFNVQQNQVGETIPTDVLRRVNRFGRNNNI